MPLYVNLYKFTDQGRKTLKDSPKRVHQITAMAAKSGVKILQTLYVTGQYDVVVISEAPNDQVALSVGLAITSAGNVVGETLHAYTVEEMEKIVSKIA